VNVSTKTRQPATLLEEALQAEHDRHKRRLAELKAAEARLHMLDEYVPRLRANGIRIYADQITFHSVEKELFITSAFTSASLNWRLVDALTELGFVQVERDDYSSFVAIRLKRGRLQLRMHVSARRPEPPPAPEQPAAAQQVSA
jgi:hypothetical protein